MEKIKISSLGILDEQKFKKIASERQDWLNSGVDMLPSNTYSVNKLAYEIELICTNGSIMFETYDYKIF